MSELFDIHSASEFSSHALTHSRLSEFRAWKKDNLKKPSLRNDFGENQKLEIATLYRFEKSIPEVILCQWWFWAHQEPFVTNTSDQKRFQDWLSFELWLSSQDANRTFYALMSSSGQLQALSWMAIGKQFSNEKNVVVTVPEALSYNASSAVRVFGERGKGMGTVLKHSMNKNITETHNEVSGFWVSIKKHNIASQRMNEKLGFAVIGFSEDGQSIYFGKSVAHS